MRPVDLAKLVFAILGVGIWAFGMRTGQPSLEWLGIGVLVVAFLTRFVSRTRPPRR